MFEPLKFFCKYFHLGLNCLLRFYLFIYVEVLTERIICVFFFFFSDTHKVDLSLNPVIVSDNAQTRSDLGLHYLFASFSSNIQNVYKFKNNSVVPDQAFSAELI